MEHIVFVWPKENTQRNDKKLKMVKLRHPRTKTTAAFLLNKSSELQEILNFKDGHRSWFFDNRVVSNEDNLRLCTPIDKILLLLPYMEENSKNFSPLQDLVVDEDYPSNQLVFEENMDLSCIADKKRAAGIDVYRLNKSKAINYLMEKLERIASVLKERKMDVSMGNFSTHCKDVNTDVNDNDYKRFAHGILSEYISNDFSQELLKECHLSSEEEISASPTKGSPEESECEPKSKRQKSNGSCDEPSEDYSKGVSNPKAQAKNSTAKMSNAQKKLMNSSKKGMKNIQSFFGKPK